MNTTGALATILVAVATYACDDAQTTSCGSSGRAISGSDGRSYCVYRVERGCPDAFPFPLRIDGVLVCSQVLSTPSELPPEVCSEIGRERCTDADAGPTDAGPDDMGSTDAGPADTGSADGGSTDTGPRGDAGCIAEPWPFPTVPRMASGYGNHISIATSEMDGHGFFHLGFIQDGQALVITRSVAAPGLPLSPPEVSVSDEWTLNEAEDIALARDESTGDVYVVVLHTGSVSNDRDRVTIGRIQPGGTTVVREGRVVADDGMVGDAERTHGRAGMVGGTEGVARRFVWRVQRPTGASLASIGASYAPGTYFEASGRIPDSRFVDLRATTRRIVLVPEPSGLLLWDAVEELPLGEFDAPGRVGRATMLYERRGDGGSGASAEYLLAYPFSRGVYMHSVTCTPECVVGIAESVPNEAGALGLTTLDAFPGGYLLGVTANDTLPMFVQLDMGVAVVPDTFRMLPPAPGRVVRDMQTATVRNGDDVYAVIVILSSPSGTPEPDAIYITALHVPASCGAM